jgi:hypothetical protein
MALVRFHGLSQPKGRHAGCSRLVSGFGSKTNRQPRRSGEMLIIASHVCVRRHGYENNLSDGGMSLAQKEAFAAQGPRPKCPVVGDSQLLSTSVSGQSTGKGAKARHQRCPERPVLPTAQGSKPDLHAANL